MQDSFMQLSISYISIIIQINLLLISANGITWILYLKNKYLLTSVFPLISCLLGVISIITVLNIHKKLIELSLYPDQYQKNYKEIFSNLEYVFWFDIIILILILFGVFLRYANGKK